MIEMKNVSYSYSANEGYAVNNISLEIPDGKWISILGHNGSGKSTFAKLLVGLIECSKGSIVVDGLELNEENANEIRKMIGIVFQNPDNQFVGVTVKKDIAFGLENRQMPREVMLDLIDNSIMEVGLSGYEDREPHRLSGGEKQRVAIAGILALDSKYIIFDEATSMLDPTGVNDVVALIQKLKQETNKTIITITHDLKIAHKSDYVYIFKNGTITGSGTPEEVFEMEEILNDSNIEVPFELQLYKAAEKDLKLNKDRKLMDVLCQLSSKK